MSKDKTNFRFMTLDEAVSGAMMALGQTSDLYRNMFREWAHDGNRHIGVIHNINIRDKEDIPIKNLSFDMPCDYLEALEITLKTGANTSVFPLLVVNNTTSNLANDPINFVSIVEQKDKFVLSSNANYTHATLKYYALPLDDDGFPLIPEYNKRAVEAYVEFMFTKSMRHRKRGQQDAPPQSEVQYLYGQWIILKRDAITNKNRLNVLEADEVVRKWMTLLPQKGPVKNTRKRQFVGRLSI